MSARQRNPITILLVDDQPAKLTSYEVMLADLGENLIKAGSARSALEALLKNDVAVILVDVCMPEVDGFELATIVREHPRFQRTAIIFVSAVQVSELDRLRGYEAGAVDYVPVPVVPEVLRAKVKVFAELHRKTRELEQLNSELERRVADRTAALEASTRNLRESEQRRSLALAAGRMGCWDWDLITRAVSWDEGQFRIFGTEQGRLEPTADAVAALVHPDDLAAVRRASRSAIARRKPCGVEFRIIRPDGEVRWCVAAAAQTSDSEGKPLRVSGVTFDITERKSAEDALKDLNEQLEQRIQDRTREREVALAQLFEAQKIDTIGQLTGGVAHDFNNLLMAILGSLELLRKRLPTDDARARRLLENAVLGAERGAALTQRLLAFARRQELKPESIDIAALVSGVENFLERAIGPGILLTKNLPTDLAPVRVDANQLELALLNLCVNARDAMPIGGSLSIAASNERVAESPQALANGLKSGAYLKISVSDTGNGMDADTLAKAPGPFFTTKGVGKGTGLGLSMVDGLAAQSGGALKIASQIGRGTTVELWLPCAEGNASNKNAGTSNGDTSENLQQSEKARPLRILVVDDDKLVSLGTAEMLKDLGHSVVEADSAAAALEMLRSEHSAFELVVSDHAMPGMTGLELGRLLRDSYPNLQFILATAYADLPDDQTSNFARLAKPFRQAELAKIIDTLFKGIPIVATNVVNLRAN